MTPPIVGQAPELAAPAVTLEPDDEFNRELVHQTHPPTWVNPRSRGRYQLVVMGAGTAGLSAAGACAAVGGRVALIERHLTGGDCLVSGCVPSKGIISAARAAAWVQRAAAYGVRVPSGTTVDFPAVMTRMRRLRAQLSPADAVTRLAAMGIDVFLGTGRLTGRDTVEVGGATLRFTRAVIATGGRAAVPPIPGLREAGFLTNETLFELTALPPRLVILGAGPIGSEMAQTFQRLGSRVTLLDPAPRILIRDDEEAAAIVQRTFEREGVRVLLGARVTRVERRAGATVVVAEHRGTTVEVPCDGILVSAGRAPNVEGVGLDAAGVAWGPQGIQVTPRLQTTNPRIYAAGDVCAPFKFTHTANVLGRMAMVNGLFWGRGRMDALVVPWCTYTDPELAHVGCSAEHARAQGERVVTHTVPLAENDRAVLDGETEGFVRVHLRRGTDRVLGATIVAAHAGELLTLFTVGMVTGRGLGTLAKAIYPYPTQAEAIKRLAQRVLAGRLTPRVTWILGRVLAWRR